jgi:hypothetical protein
VTVKGISVRVADSKAAGKNFSVVIADIASFSLPMILTHELIARTAAALAARGIELPTFASPTVPGVTLHDVDIVFVVYGGADDRGSA